MGMEPGSRALALHCRHEFNVQHCKTSKQVNKEAKKQMWVKEEEWTHLSILLRRCKVLCDVWSPLCLLHLQSPSPFMCDTYMSTCTHACRRFLRSRKKRDVVNIQGLIFCTRGSLVWILTLPLFCGWLDDFPPFSMPSWFHHGTQMVKAEFWFCYWVLCGLGCKLYMEGVFHGPTL